MSTLQAFITASRVDIVDQREQQMLQRRIFVPALIGEGQRLMEGFFEIAGKGRHSDPHFFSMMHCSGC